MWAGSHRTPICCRLPRVSSREFRDRLLRRARRAGVAVDNEMLSPLEAYFRLLTRWNEKINLTALPLRNPNDETFDRLLIEPLAAARLVGATPSSWFDLGSGGGSPAVPMKIARPNLNLTMVESKVRKAAFLREAVRTLGLPSATVQNVRFQELTEKASLAASADLVTVRAVKIDAALFQVARHLLRDRGRFLLFGFRNGSARVNGFGQMELNRLMESTQAHLGVMERVFHVEQRR